MGTVGKPTAEEGARATCARAGRVWVSLGWAQLRNSAGRGRQRRAELPGLGQRCVRGGKESCLWQGSEVQHRAAVKGETGCVWFPWESVFIFLNVSFLGQVGSCVLLLRCKKLACLCWSWKDQTCLEWRQTASWLEKWKPVFIFTLFLHCFFPSPNKCLLLIPVSPHSVGFRISI